MKISFDVKYGRNEIEIPITENTVPKYTPYNFKNKFINRVTIFNDIPSDGVSTRRFDKFVIDKCIIYNQMSEGADGTIQKIVNAQNVITKDIEHYKTPTEYAQIPVDEKDNYYTVQVDDFVVLDEVDDVVTTAKEFQNLQQKYKTKGFSVTSVNASIYGIPVDNVHIMHA